MACTDVLQNRPLPGEGADAEHACDAVCKPLSGTHVEQSTYLQCAGTVAHAQCESTFMHSYVRELRASLLMSIAQCQVSYGL